VQAAGAPLAIVGVIIAAIVLLPETAAATRAAARRQLQASINLALGSDRGLLHHPIDVRFTPPA
jgi:Ca2+:H+ antiporter